MVKINCINDIYVYMSVLTVILLVGVWPDSLSFSDEGMETVPTKWKGECQNGTAFDSSRCNR